MRCTLSVDRIGYYSVHPVTLFRASVYHPVTSRPPCWLPFFRTQKKTFVVGDGAAFHSQSAVVKSGVALRGDHDFARVFVHARSVSVDADVFDPNGNLIHTKAVEFHCKNCFEPLVKPQRSMSLKGARLQIVDGTWHPGMV
jgi:hypothetical protein